MIKHMIDRIQFASHVLDPRESNLTTSQFRSSSSLYIGLSADGDFIELRCQETKNTTYVSRHCVVWWTVKQNVKKATKPKRQDRKKGPRRSRKKSEAEE